MPFLIKENKNGEYEVKEVFITQEPNSIKALMSPIGWKIVKYLSNNPSYPNKIAKDLNINRQNVHYYIKKLKDENLVKLVKREEVKGGLAKLYELNYTSFALEIPKKGEIVKNFYPMPDTLKAFFHPIISQNKLQGYIVVGSPEPHGPYKAFARDGHYAAYLSLFLGKYIDFPENFIVKLDVDIIVEKELENNLILIGGPGVNMVTSNVNPYLPIKFNEKNYWLGLIKGSKTYNNDHDALIAKIRNPFNSSKYIIVLAGVRHGGTKAAIIALTKNWKKILEDYKGEEEWAKVIRGFDMDGDGKIDSVEIID